MAFTISYWRAVCMYFCLCGNRRVRLLILYVRGLPRFPRQCRTLELPTAVAAAVTWSRRFRAWWRCINGASCEFVSLSSVFVCQAALLSCHRTLSVHEQVGPYRTHCLRRLLPVRGLFVRLSPLSVPLPPPQHQKQRWLISAVAGLGEHRCNCCFVPVHVKFCDGDMLDVFVWWTIGTVVCLQSRGL